MKAAQIAAPWGNAGNLISQLCDQKEIGHAYLLVGPANSAKTDAAMLLANAAVSGHPPTRTPKRHGIPGGTDSRDA